MQVELSLIQLLALFNNFKDVLITNVLNTDAMAWKYKDQFCVTAFRKLLDEKYCLY